MRRKRICLALLLLSFFALNAFSAEKKSKIDPQVEAEAKEAQAEDDAAAGREHPGGHEFNARGKLLLSDVEDGQKPQVVGLFAADGRSYQVKVDRDDLRQQLKAFNNKDVALGGKVRNAGKYLIVQEILSGAPKPDAMRNPRGL